MTVELSPRATEIAEHTKQLLAAGGYNGFSYADLSERIQIGKPSIHHHFPSKAELVLTVVARHREQSRDGLAALDEAFPDPVARLRAYADYWAGCIRDGSSPICICAMLAAELPMIPTEIAAEVRRYFGDLSGWLATVLDQGAGQAKFRLRGTPAEEAQAFMSTIHGAMLTARAFNDAQAFACVSQVAIDRLLPSS